MIPDTTPVYLVQPHNTHCQPCPGTRLSSRDAGTQPITFLFWKADSLGVTDLHSDSTEAVQRLEPQGIVPIESCIRPPSSDKPGSSRSHLPMADRESILAAIANRRNSTTPSSPTPASPSNRPSIPNTHAYSSFDKDHDRRQEFRRLVDPGITRPNSREVAYEAIKVRSIIYLSS